MTDSESLSTLIRVISDVGPDQCEKCLVKGASHGKSPENVLKGLPEQLVAILITEIPDSSAVLKWPQRTGNVMPKYAKHLPSASVLCLKSWCILGVDPSISISCGLMLTRH